jgi:hypothetical protein
MTQPGKENQHYVPKMLLRSFSISDGARRGQEQVHVLDKSNSKTFIANIRNVAAAFEFYEAEMAGRVVNAAAILSELESHASAALRKVLSAGSVAVLDVEERMWLAAFCSAQFVRTQAARHRIGAMQDGVKAHIVRQGFDPAEADAVLWVACFDFGRLCGGKPVEADAFELWFYAMRDEVGDLQDEAIRAVAALYVPAGPPATRRRRQSGFAPGGVGRSGTWPKSTRAAVYHPAARPGAARQAAARASVGLGGKNFVLGLANYRASRSRMPQGGRERTRVKASQEFPQSGDGRNEPLFRKVFHRHV